MAVYVYGYEGEEINVDVTEGGIVTIADKNGWRGHQVITFSSVKDIITLKNLLVEMLTDYKESK
jgi:hypothetical protein